MKTKTLLIHLAVACIGLSAHAQLGVGLSGGGGLSLGRSSGNASVSSGTSVSPGRRSFFGSNTSASVGLQQRGASSYAPGRSSFLPPGHGGTPPGQRMLQNRSGWSNRGWWNRGSASNRTSISVGANTSTRSGLFSRRSTNVSSNANLGASSSTRSGLFGRNWFGRSSTSASVNTGASLRR